MNSENEEKVLAEAMAFLEEQERLEEEARQKAEAEKRAKANEPVSEQSYAEQYASGFICGQRTKESSEVPMLQLHYSFMSITDDLRENSYCKRIHVDIIRNENLGWYGNINNRPSEVQKVGELEIEIYDWQRAAENHDLLIAAGIARNSNIIDYFFDNHDLMDKWKPEMEKCQSKNILYIHSMRLTGSSRHKGWGAYVLKSIFDTFHDMFGLMVIDPDPMHFLYLEGDYREPGYDYSQQLDQTDIFEDNDHAFLHLMCNYESLGFRCTDDPLASPYRVWSLMYLNAYTPSPLRDLDIYVFWDY